MNLKKIKRMFELLDFLERKILEIELSYRPDEETGPYLSYNIIDDNTIDLDYGWTSYEEYSHNVVRIIFEDKIIIDRNNRGYCVFGDGEYENIEHTILDNTNNLIDWLNAELE